MLYYIILYYIYICTCEQKVTATQMCVYVCVCMNIMYLFVYSIYFRDGIRSIVLFTHLDAEYRVRVCAGVRV